MRCISVSLVLTVLIVFTLANVGAPTISGINESTFAISLEVDPPIAIDDNGDFDYLEFPGEGTADQPYIIEGYSFLVGEGYWMAGIKIQDTTAHFIIQNCNFTGYTKTEEPTYDDFGIHLKNVVNGVIRNCNFSELMYGVFLAHCEDIIVEYSNFTGMNIEWVQFENMGRGIGTGTIDDVNRGIVIRNNYMENCSNGVLLMEVEEFDCYSNLIFNCGTGIHAEHDVTNGTIRDNTILNGTHAGIQATRLNAIRILNNTCMYNRLYGIWLDDDAIDNLVYSNTLSYNGDFLAESGSGVYVDNLGSGNNITMNDLINNQENVLNYMDETFYNLNYYSDYTGTDEDGDGVGEDPHTIPVVSGVSDLHPRVLTLSEWFIQYPPPVTTTNTTVSNSTTTTTTINDWIPFDQLILISGATFVVVLIIFVIGLRKRP